MGAALFLVDKISLLLMVLTLGGRSYLNVFVTEENTALFSLLASSPAPPRLALFSLARLIADRVFARPLDYPERDCWQSKKLLSSKRVDRKYMNKNYYC